MECGCRRRKGRQGAGQGEQLPSREAPGLLLQAPHTLSSLWVLQGRDEGPFRLQLQPRYQAGPLLWRVADAVAPLMCTCVLPSTRELAGFCLAHSSTLELVDLAACVGISFFPDHIVSLMS